MSLPRKWIPYLLLAPTFFIITVFIYYPAYQSFFMSLYKVSPFGTSSRFVGFENFLQLFQSGRFLQSVYTTLIFVVVTVGIGLVLSLFLAMLLNDKIPGIGIFRTLIFSPYAVSPAVAGVLWAFLLSPLSGYVSYLFLIFFKVQPQWLTTYPLALIAVMIATIWQNIGFNVIFFLAGLQSIPKSYYEAATIDGANSVDKLFNITIPLLSPITFFLIIMNISSSVFYSFAAIDVMTEGGPSNTTTTMMYEVYREGFFYFNNGAASSESVILILIMAFFTYLYFKFGQKAVHYQ